MRIIAGKWKGRRLKAVKGLKTRPTADMVKEAVFNILGEKVSKSIVLDLFAGTGSLSLEALSRGAALAVLVDKSHSAIKTIEENLSTLQAVEQTRILKMDALAFLKQGPKESYDLIFLDPPYDKGYISKVMSYLNNDKWLNRNGVIVAETGVDEEFDMEASCFEIRIAREYGDTKLWFIQSKED